MWIFFNCKNILHLCEKHKEELKGADKNQICSLFFRFIYVRVVSIVSYKTLNIALEVAVYSGNAVLYKQISIKIPKHCVMITQ